MREFKFACPVCGQHLTADADHAGSHIECPTCFRNIVVPQAPQQAEQKLIVTAAAADRPRPTGLDTAVVDTRAHAPARTRNLGTLVMLGSLLVLSAAVVGYMKLRPRPPAPPSPVASTPPAPAYTGPAWTLDLQAMKIPDQPATGRVHGQPFKLQRATIQGGTLSLRQGATWPPDLGLTLLLPVKHTDDLTNRTVHIAADLVGTAPKAVLRWKEGTNAVTRSFTGGYALHLEFSQPLEGKLPGKIYVCLPDPEQSVIAGTFAAEIRAPDSGQKRPQKKTR